MNTIVEKWRGGIIVSCQAPANSPLALPEIIAAFAEVAEQNGAVGVRIDSPAHIRAVKQRVKVPILGIHKIVSDSSEVYITPTFGAAQGAAAAGADVIALDATLRARPEGERLVEIVSRIKNELKLPVMADVSTLDEGLHAAEKTGVDFVGTTLSGYTASSGRLTRPDFELVERLARRIDLPVICEGRVRSPEDVRRAFECGASAVVIGGAITGVDQLVRQFVEAASSSSCAPAVQSRIS